MSNQSIINGETKYESIQMNDYFLGKNLPPLDSERAEEKEDEMRNSLRSAFTFNETEHAWGDNVWLKQKC